MKDKLVIVTQDNLIYFIIYDKPVFGKPSMTIKREGREFEVIGIRDADRKDKSPSPADVKAGHIILFNTSGERDPKVNSTSAIKEVYKKID